MHQMTPTILSYNICVGLILNKHVRIPNNMWQTTCYYYF